MRSLSLRTETGPLRLYMLCFKLRAEGPPLRVAFSVPKRHARKAARRNRIRRLLREAYRLQKPNFSAALPQGSAWLLWQWLSPKAPTLLQLKETMQQLFFRALPQCAMC